MEKCRTCPVCYGSGEVQGPGFSQSCPDCLGEGLVSSNHPGLDENIRRSLNESKPVEYFERSLLGAGACCLGILLVFIFWTFLSSKIDIVLEILRKP